MSVPNATLLAAIVVLIDVFPRSVIVAEPVTSPVNEIVGSLTLKSKVPSESSYVTLIPLSVLDDTIPPTTSCTLSVVWYWFVPSGTNVVLDGVPTITDAPMPLWFEQ